MKKILIIEDDQIVANVYRNKLVVDGYQTEAALDGETGLKMVRTFRPDAIVLDLILPQMSGVDVIKEIRGDKEFAKLPIIVLSNTYLTNLIRDAWQAGATKCVSKINCSPKALVEMMHATIGDSGAIKQAPRKTEGTPAAAASPARARENEATFQDNLRKTFVTNLPATLADLRVSLQGLTKADTETVRLKQIHELYRRVHTINGVAALAGLAQIAHMSTALEALLKELHENPKTINESTLRTVAAAVDFFNFLNEHGTQPDRQEIPPASILVVDDEPISRRAVVLALQKARLPSVSVEDPDAALKLLSEKLFDIVFLDVLLPGMTGYDLCARLRGLPMHKKTPVVFVTHLSDLDNRAKSTVVGGNDFITKPFLSVELAVKALIYVLRGKLQSPKG
jgi:CheY-like chemotaxis protein/HPt (histidine-containing phosphotransfer) domain-containing protein